MRSTTTSDSTLVAASRSSSGYWTLAAGPGEAHVTRHELLREPSSAPLGEPLLTIGHLSDLHICDSQSPARAEFLDRWADDDSPVKELVQGVGTYRAQECLTVQVAEAMVRALNAVTAGPVGGAPLDWTVVTGDVTDNAQTNEIGWYLRLLDGGPVVPDSGDPSRYEGVAASDEHFDEWYWHPDQASPAGHVSPTGRGNSRGRGNSTGRTDRPHRLHGFPSAPGLLDEIRMPFDAGGLAMPWLAVHGNHDQMIQGTIPANLVSSLGSSAVGSAKAIALPEHWSHDAIAQFCHDVDTCQVSALTVWDSLPSRTVTPDLMRETATRSQFIAAHFGSSARPRGHGFAPDAVETARAYYRFDHESDRGQLSVFALDTVNQHGGWQGSLDLEQFAWLDSELSAADSEGRYAVLASHHSSATLINPRIPDGATDDGPQRRVLGDELIQMLARHPSVVLWLNGHTHITGVTPHATDIGGWWEVTAPSLIDYPQQGRVVELLRSGTGELTVAATMVDHAGEAPWSGAVDSVTAMAGLSRELAANDWQWRTDDLARHARRGGAGDRNVLLPLPDPFR